MYFATRHFFVVPFTCLQVPQAADLPVEAPPDADHLAEVRIRATLFPFIRCLLECSLFASFTFYLRDVTFVREP